MINLIIIGLNILPGLLIIESYVSWSDTDAGYWLFIELNNEIKTKWFKCTQ